MQSSWPPHRPCLLLLRNQRNRRHRRLPLLPPWHSHRHHHQRLRQPPQQQQRRRLQRLSSAKLSWKARLPCWQGSKQHQTASWMCCNRRSWRRLKAAPRQCPWPQQPQASAWTSHCLPRPLLWPAANPCWPPSPLPAPLLDAARGSRGVTLPPIDSSRAGIASQLPAQGTEPSQDGSAAYFPDLSASVLGGPPAAEEAPAPIAAPAEQQPAPPQASPAPEPAPSELVILDPPDEQPPSPAAAGPTRPASPLEQAAASLAPSPPAPPPSSDAPPSSPGRYGMAPFLFKWHWLPQRGHI